MYLICSRVIFETHPNSGEAGLLRGEDRARDGLSRPTRTVVQWDEYSAERVKKVGLPARGKSYLSNKLMRYLKVRCPQRPSRSSFLTQSQSFPVARIRCQGNVHCSSFCRC
jgi:hypothetical protein